jgi:MFS family permease
VPPFARDQSHISEREIGAIFFVNTALIVIVPLPISRAIEGRRRTRALALMPMLWVIAWLLVEAGGLWFDATAAFVVFALALAIFGIGECFHGPAHQALVAKIAPDRLRGRYLRSVRSRPSRTYRNGFGASRARSPRHRCSTSRPQDETGLQWRTCRCTL